MRYGRRSPRRDGCVHIGRGTRYACRARRLSGTLDGPRSRDCGTPDATPCRAGRRRAEEAVTTTRGQLEARVRERTAELARALAEAVGAQHRFRDLVNSVDGIVWEADATMRQFSFVSDQAERILGYTAEHWLSEPTFWQGHLHRDDRQSAVRFRETASAEKRDGDCEYRRIAGDG